MHPPQSNSRGGSGRVIETRPLFCGTVISGIPFKAAGRGVGALLWSLLGLPPAPASDDVLQPIDSIDIIIVGLGLLLVLLVLLRR